MQNNHVVTSDRWPDPNRQDKCEQVSIAANAKGGGTIELIPGVTIKLKTPNGVSGIDTNGFRAYLARLINGVSDGDVAIDRAEKTLIYYSSDGDVTWQTFSTALAGAGTDYSNYFGALTVKSPNKQTDKIPIEDNDADYWFSSSFSVGGHDGVYVEALDYSHFLAFSSQNPFTLRTMTKETGMLEAACEVRATYVSRRLARNVGFALGLVDSTPITLTMERGRVLVT